MTVKLYVKEKETGIPIPFVLVRVESPEFVATDATDANGMAEITINNDGKYLIKVRHKNYRPYTEKTYISHHSIIELKLQRAY